MSTMAEISQNDHASIGARMRSVLEAAAKAVGWTPAPAPSGRGYGWACGIDAGTCVAHVAKVAVDENNTGPLFVNRCSETF